MGPDHRTVETYRDQPTQEYSRNDEAIGALREQIAELDEGYDEDVEALVTSDNADDPDEEYEAAEEELHLDDVEDAIEREDLGHGLGW
jgi:hypothetical protein